MIGKVDKEAGLISDLLIGIREYFCSNLVHSKTEMQKDLNDIEF